MRAVVVAVLLCAACTNAPVAPAATTAPPPLAIVTAPPAATAPARVATPQPTPDIRIPTTPGPVPEAGVLVARDAFGTLYRYDGGRGTIERITELSAWSILRQTATGVYEVGTHGGAVFVPWSGTTRLVSCPGWIVAISRADACASRVSDPPAGMYVQYPGTGARRILPLDWGGGVAAWDPGSRRLAITRTVDERCMRCPDALYVIDADGTPRLLFDTHVDANHTDPRGAVARMAWSPDGDLIATSFSTGCAGCDFKGGSGLLLIDPATSRFTDLGVTPGSPSDLAWSPTGELAYVSGTFEKIADSVLRLRGSDGTVGALDTYAAHPTWSADGGRLAWIRSDGTAAVLDRASDARTVVRCRDGSVAGIRFGTDDSMLLLCRMPDRNVGRYDIRYLDATHDAVVMEQLGGTLAYFIGPDFLDLVAWSKGVAPIF